MPRFSCCLSATGIGFPGHPTLAGRLGLLCGRLTGHVTVPGSHRGSRVPHARDATGVGASCISGAAVLIRPTKNPRPAPAASQRPAPVPRLNPSARLTHNETSTEVHAIHPSGLPLARDPWMVQGSFGFPPELRTPPLPATHAEGGARPLSTCLRLRTRHPGRSPFCESTRYVRPRVAADYCGPRLGSARIASGRGQPRIGAGCTLVARSGPARRQ